MTWQGNFICELMLFSLSLIAVICRPIFGKTSWSEKAKILSKSCCSHWGCLSHKLKGAPHGGRWQLVYQIYLPVIDTLVTGMGVQTDFLPFQHNLAPRRSESDYIICFLQLLWGSLFQLFLCARQKVTLTPKSQKSFARGNHIPPMALAEFRFLPNDSCF